MGTKSYLFTYTQAVVWGDLDALGHVNNCRYFEYMQEARIQWLKTLNLDLTMKEGPVVVHVACTYLKPVFYPATLEVRCHLHSPGRSSVIMDYDMYLADELMATGSSKMVWVDYIEGGSVPLPDSIRALAGSSSN